MCAQWMSDEHVLIIDDDALCRDALVFQLERSGYRAHSAASYKEGLRLFQSNEDVKVVVLDHPTVGANVRSVIHLLRSARPDTVIVGNSGLDRRAEFAAAGVKRYLQKPWRVADLRELLERRLKSCVECNLPLPLTPRSGRGRQQLDLHFLRLALLRGPRRGLPGRDPIKRAARRARGVSTAQRLGAIALRQPIDQRILSGRAHHHDARRPRREGPNVGH